MMDTEHSVVVENFLKLARTAGSKQEYLARVKEFDQRYP